MTRKALEIKGLSLNRNDLAVPFTVNRLPLWPLPGTSWRTHPGFLPAEDLPSLPSTAPTYADGSGFAAWVNGGGVVVVDLETGANATGNAPQGGVLIPKLGYYYNRQGRVFLGDDGTTGGVNFYLPETLDTGGLEKGDYRFWLFYFRKFPAGLFLLTWSRTQAVLTEDNKAFRLKISDPPGDGHVARLYVQRRKEKGAWTPLTYLGEFGAQETEFIYSSHLQEGAQEYLALVEPGYQGRREPTAAHYNGRYFMTAQRLTVFGDTKQDYKPGQGPQNPGLSEGAYAVKVVPGGLDFYPIQQNAPAIPFHPFDRWDAAAWSPTHGILAAVRVGGKTHLYRTKDGYDWSLLAQWSSEIEFKAIAIGEEEAVLAGPAGGFSVNLSGYQVNPLTPGDALNDAYYDSQAKVFVACGPTGVFKKSPGAGNWQALGRPATDTDYEPTHVVHVAGKVFVYAKKPVADGWKARIFKWDGGWASYEPGLAWSNIQGIGSYRFHMDITHQGFSFLDVINGYVVWGHQVKAGVYQSDYVVNFGSKVYVEAGVESGNVFAWYDPNRRPGALPFQPDNRDWPDRISYKRLDLTGNAAGFKFLKSGSPYPFAVRDGQYATTNLVGPNANNTGTYYCSINPIPNHRGGGVVRNGGLVAPLDYGIGPTPYRLLRERYTKAIIGGQEAVFFLPTSLVSDRQLLPVVGSAIQPVETGLRDGEDYIATSLRWNLVGSKMTWRLYKRQGDSLTLLWEVNASAPPEATGQEAIKVGDKVGFRVSNPDGSFQRIFFDGQTYGVSNPSSLATDGTDLFVLDGGTLKKLVGGSLQSTGVSGALAISGPGKVYVATSSGEVLEVNPSTYATTSLGTPGGTPISGDYLGGSLVVSTSTGTYARQGNGWVQITPQSAEIFVGGGGGSGGGGGDGDAAAPTSNLTLPPNTIVWTEPGYINLTTPYNYTSIKPRASQNINALITHPAGVMAFLQNETYVLTGQFTSVTNTRVAPYPAMVGVDDDSTYAVVGGAIYVVWNGRLYLVGHGSAYTTIYGSAELLSAEADDGVPFTSVAYDASRLMLFARKLDGRVLGFYLPRKAWFNHLDYSYALLQAPREVYYLIADPLFGTVKFYRIAPLTNDPILDPGYIRPFQEIWLDSAIIDPGDIKLIRGLYIPSIGPGDAGITVRIYGEGGQLLAERQATPTLTSNTGPSVGPIRYHALVAPVVAYAPRRISLTLEGYWAEFPPYIEVAYDHRTRRV